MRPLIYQHEIFTDRSAADAFALEMSDDLASDETLAVVPDAAGARFIVSLRAGDEHLMFI